MSKGVLNCPGVSSQARQKYPQEETRGARKVRRGGSTPKPAAPTIDRRGVDGPTEVVARILRSRSRMRGAASDPLRVSQAALRGSSKRRCLASVAGFTRLAFGFRRRRRWWTLRRRRWRSHMRLRWWWRMSDLRCRRMRNGLRPDLLFFRHLIAWRLAASTACGKPLVLELFVRRRAGRSAGGATCRQPLFLDPFAGRRAGRRARRIVSRTVTNIGTAVALRLDRCDRLARFGRDNSGAVQPGGVRGGGDCRMSVISVERQRRILGRKLDMVSLLGSRRNVVLFCGGELLRRGSRGRAAGAAVVADIGCCSRSRSCCRHW